MRPHREVSEDKTKEVKEMKANETKKNEVKKPVETEKPVQQVQHRQKRDYFLYSPTNKQFLMSDRKFGISGELFVFHSITEAKAVKGFVGDDCIVLTKAV